MDCTPTTQRCTGPSNRCSRVPSSPGTTVLSADIAACMTGAIWASWGPSGLHYYIWRGVENELPNWVTAF